MNNIDHLNAEQVGSVPPKLEPGLLYVSEKYSTAAHLCCCGCGQEVFTPLSAAQWRVVIEDGEISVYPSIGNWALACQSHYVIRRGQVQWRRSFSDGEIALNRQTDRRLLAEKARRHRRGLLRRVSRRIFRR